MSNSFSTSFPSSFRGVLQNSMQQCKNHIHVCGKAVQESFQFIQGYVKLFDFCWFEYYVKAREGCYNHFKDIYANASETCWQ